MFCDGPCICFLISHSLTAGGFDLWMIDLYFARDIDGLLVGLAELWYARCRSHCWDGVGGSALHFAHAMHEVDSKQVLSRRRVRADGGTLQWSTLILEWRIWYREIEDHANEELVRTFSVICVQPVVDGTWERLSWAVVGPRWPRCGDCNKGTREHSRQAIIARRSVVGACNDIHDQMGIS